MQTLPKLILDSNFDLIDSMNAPNVPAAHQTSQKRKKNYWSEEETKKLEEALSLFKKNGTPLSSADLKNISQFIGSRTIPQVRSKLQKYFQKKEKQNRIKLLKGEKTSCKKSKHEETEENEDSIFSILEPPAEKGNEQAASKKPASIQESGEEENYDQDDSSDDQRSREGGFLEEVERKKQANRLLPFE